MENPRGFEMTRIYKDYLFMYFSALAIHLKPLNMSLDANDCFKHRGSRTIVLVFQGDEGKPILYRLEFYPFLHWCHPQVFSFGLDT